jgi:hypothetical protein
MDFDKDLHVGEPADRRGSNRDIEIIGDCFGERAIAVAGEDFHGG